MTTIRISLKIKVPDTMTDEELQKLFMEYLNVRPTKSARFSKYPDSLGWLA